MPLVLNGRIRLVLRAASAAQGERRPFVVDRDRVRKRNLHRDESGASVSGSSRTLVPEADPVPGRASTAAGHVLGADLVPLVVRLAGRPVHGLGDEFRGAAGSDCV